MKHFNKEPRLQGGALKPNSKPKTEIPKQVRDDKKTKTSAYCHAELISASDLLLSAFSRRIFHPRPQDGVFRCEFNKILGITICYLLSAICFLVLLGCQQVQKPEVRGEGPLAVNMARGLTSPEFHAPLERWRTTHKKALSIGDFTERECILCHDPKKSCNNCHTYIGVRAIDVPEASLFWPEEKKEKE